MKARTVNLFFGFAFVLSLLVFSQTTDVMYAFLVITVLVAWGIVNHVNNW